MSIEMICAQHAPAVIGPFSHAVKAGDFLFVSGQSGAVPETGRLAGDTLEEQAQQLMLNMGAVLAEAGADFTHAVKVNAYLSDMKYFSAFNAIYDKYFKTKPARTCIAAKELPLGILCEVEMIAYLGK